MKIDLGGGRFIEPDEGERNTRFHMRIVSTERIPHTRCGHYARLECGHRVMMFGNVELAGGVALCVVCRDQRAAEAN